MEAGFNSRGPRIVPASPSPRSYRRTIAAAAIRRPRTGARPGGASHSRRLNGWRVDVLTARRVAGVRNSQSPITAN